MKTKAEIIDYFRNANVELASRFFREKFGMSNFSDPIYDEVDDKIEDRYFDLTRELLRDIEQRIFAERRHGVRVVRFIGRLLAK